MDDEKNYWMEVDEGVRGEYCGCFGRSRRVTKYLRVFLSTKLKQDQTSKIGK